MKKSIVLILVLMLLTVLFGCAKPTPPAAFAAPTPEPTEAPQETKAPKEVPAPAMVEPLYFNSFERLVSASDGILIGTSVDVHCKQTGEFETYAYSEILVKEVFKGDFKENETVTLSELGGKSEEYDMILQFAGKRVPYIQADTEYLLFIMRIDLPAENSYRYAPISCFVGFSEIKDGMVYPGRSNNLIEEPMPLEDAKQWITECLEYTAGF